MKLDLQFYLSRLYDSEDDKEKRTALYVRKNRNKTEGYRPLRKNTYYCGEVCIRNTALINNFLTHSDNISIKLSRMKVFSQLVLSFYSYFCGLQESEKILFWERCDECISKYQKSCGNRIILQVHSSALDSFNYLCEEAKNFYLRQQGIYAFVAKVILYRELIESKKI